MRIKQVFQARWLAAITAVMIAAAARSAYACAMCGLPLGDVKTHAYNSSVIFMMAVPYSIFLIGLVVAFFAYRNACRRREAEDSYTVSQTVPNR